MIASILLILLVVSIFSVVGYFLRKSPERAMEKGSEMFEEMMSCEEIDLQIENVCYRNIPCIENEINERCDVIKVRIKNNNNLQFKEGFRLKLSSGFTNVFIPEESVIDAYDARYIERQLPSNEKIENIKWIKLYPILNKNTCNSKEFKINAEEVKTCI